MSKLIGMTCLAMLFSDGFWSTINAQEIPDKAKSENSALLDEEPSLEEPPSLEDASSLDEPRGDESSSKTATQNAGDENWNLRAKRILEIGGETFADATQKNKAYKELGSLKPSSDSDPRYSYAFILVAMKEKQWSSAQKLVTELLECHEDYLPARAAKARMLLTLEKKLAAVAELELLAKGLESSSTIVSDDQLTEAARFLGLGVGYFEGPGKDSIKATALQALIATADEIPQSLQEPYSQARLAIGDEYRVLMEKGEEAFAAHKQEIAEDTERIRAELEAQREKTEKDAEATRQQLEASWANAKKEWESAWARCQLLTQNANVMQAEYARLSSSLAQMRPPKVDSNGNVDRNDERRYLDATRRLESSISTIDFQLANLYAEYEVVNRKGMIIENQMNTIRMNGQRLGMTLAAQEGSFAKVDKLVRGKERAAQKAEPKLEAKKLRFARAYSTYNDFNFHKESAILADSFP